MVGDYDEPITSNNHAPDPLPVAATGFVPTQDDVVILEAKVTAIAAINNDDVGKDEEKTFRISSFWCSLLAMAALFMAIMIGGVVLNIVRNNNRRLPPPKPIMTQEHSPTHSMQPTQTPHPSPQPTHSLRPSTSPTHSLEPSTQPSSQPTPLPSSNPSTQPTRSAHPSPQPTISAPPSLPYYFTYAARLSRFHNITIDLDMEDINGNPSSPQVKAMMHLSSWNPSGSVLFHVRTLERYLLAVIYYATNGNDWNHRNRWLTNQHIYSWYGVSCRIHMRNSMRVQTLQLGMCVCD